jgi:hypothetical protein
MKNIPTFEDFINEAKEYTFSIQYNTDEDDVEYIQNVLMDAGVDAIAEPAIHDSGQMVVKALNAIELRKAKKAIEADGFEIRESINENNSHDFGDVLTQNGWIRKESKSYVTPIGRGRLYHDDYNNVKYPLCTIRVVSGAEGDTYIELYKDGRQQSPLNKNIDSITKMKVAIKKHLQISIRESVINEDAGLIADVAIGVAVGIAGLWALAKGLPIVGDVLGGAAEAIANRAEAKAKMAAKGKRKELIAEIIKKFDDDTKLKQMYQALPDYVEFTGKNHNANLTAAKARKKGLMEIGNYIKAKLTPEEMTYFTDISSMLRTGDI